MLYVFLLGRILYGGFFFLSGLKHFRHLEMMAGYTKSKGVPFPRLAVLSSGALITLGGLGLVFGLYPNISLFLIILFLIGVTPMMHNYWKDTDPNVRANNQINFGKNIALLGAALMLFYLL